MTKDKDKPRFAEEKISLSVKEILRISLEEHQKSLDDTFRVRALAIEAYIDSHYPRRSSIRYAP